MQANRLQLLTQCFKHYRHDFQKLLIQKNKTQEQIEFEKQLTEAKMFKKMTSEVHDLLSADEQTSENDQDNLSIRDLLKIDSQELQNNMYMYTLYLPR